MSKRSKITYQNLEVLESEFESLLIKCLQQCVQGRGELFRKYDGPDAKYLARYLRWPEADRLKDLAEQIKRVRLEFGESNEICDRFLELGTLRGSNVPGERKLAGVFLEQILKRQPDA